MEAVAVSVCNLGTERNRAKSSCNNSWRTHLNSAVPEKWKLYWQEYS